MTFGSGEKRKKNDADIAGEKHSVHHPVFLRPDLNQVRLEHIDP